MKRVEVEWIDSNMLHGWIHSPQVEVWAKGNSDLFIRSIGYLYVLDTENNYIVLVQSARIDDQQHANGIKIPLVAVQVIRYLEDKEDEDEQSDSTT